MDSHTFYPVDTVQKLIETSHVSDKTRAVVEPRLATHIGSPRFFSADEFQVLTLVCNHLLDLRGDEPGVQPALDLDHRLAANRSNGWRYDLLPADREAYRLGISGLHQTATALYGQDFIQISADGQATVLNRIQQGDPPGEVWKKVRAKLFFEEMLAELAELYYSYPYAQNEIGYAGFADRHGWLRTGLNEREDIEPREATLPPSLSKDR